MRALTEIPHPQKCALWRNDSHDRRCQLRCRECGQLYFYKFLEFVDYENGADPQYRTYIPVSSEQDAAMLSEVPEWELDKYKPALHEDWPKGQDKPKTYWVRRGS